MLLESSNMKQLYLIAPPCEGTMEGFPGSLTIMKNYLDRTLGENPSEILDLEAERLSGLPRYIEEKLPKEGEFIAGITATTATYQRALETARQIKGYNPQAITVIGGHHVKKATCLAASSVDCERAPGSSLCAESINDCSEDRIIMKRSP